MLTPPVIEQPRFHGPDPLALYCQRVLVGLVQFMLRAGTLNPGAQLPRCGGRSAPPPPPLAFIPMRRLIAGVSVCWELRSGPPPRTESVSFIWDTFGHRAGRGRLGAPTASDTAAALLAADEEAARRLSMNRLLSLAQGSSALWIACCDSHSSMPDHARTPLPLSGGA